MWIVDRTIADPDWIFVPTPDNVKFLPNMTEIQALPEAVSAGWYKNGRTTIGKERGAGVCSHGAWDMRRYVQPLPLGAALTPPASACVRRTGAGAVGLGGVPWQLGH